MGRVSKDQASINRQAVVEASSALFRAKGVDGVGVRELMAAVGLTQGAFTRQFASKEALASEACAHAFEGAAEAFAAAMADTSSGQNRRFAEMYIAPKPAAHTCPMSTMPLDAGRAPEGSPLRTEFAAGLERLAHIVAGDELSQERLTLLAATVGAAILGAAGGATPVAAQIADAVIRYADELDNRT